MKMLFSCPTGDADPKGSAECVWQYCVFQTAVLDALVQVALFCSHCFDCPDTGTFGIQWMGFLSCSEILL